MLAEPSAVNTHLWLVSGVSQGGVTLQEHTEQVIRRSRRRRGGAPLPQEIRSLGYPRGSKNGGQSEAGLQGPVPAESVHRESPAEPPQEGDGVR